MEPHPGPNFEPSSVGRCAPVMPPSMFGLILNGFLTALEHLKRAGRRPSVASLLAVAERQTGLNDFGDHQFLESLAFLMESADREDKLNALGRFVFYAHIVQLLRNRLYLELDWKVDPGIGRRRIPKPVFITGLPRTGTTLLHSLLAQDDSIFVAPLTWQVIYPSPNQGDDRARMERAERQLRWFELLVPKFKPVHPVAASLPQECVAIMSHCFVSEEFDTMFAVPGYESWVEEQDQRQAYAFHRRFLQHLATGPAEHRFVLKAPAHLGSIDAILAVYPDAQIIHTYRHPFRVLPSLANLTYVLKSAFSYSVDPNEVGPSSSEYCLRHLRKFFASLDRLPSGVCTDVAYNDLVRDPIAVVRDIYARLGEQLTPTAQLKMTRFLSDPAHQKWGRNLYSLSSFGLNPDEIEDQFRFYTERFDLAVPQS